MAEKQKTELSKRLVASAKKARLTTEQIAERLDVAPSTVYSWRTGRNEPPLSMLVEWAKIVGCSIAWLATGQEDPIEQPARFADWVMVFADRVMGGEDPATAIDFAAGQTSELSERERRSLARRAASMRGFIEEFAGRPWRELTTADRQAVVQRLIEMAEE